MGDCAMIYGRRALASWGFAPTQIDQMLADGERLGLIVKIGCMLDSLYGDDDVVRRWLDQSRSELSGTTARELMLRHNLDDFFLVYDLARFDAH